MKRRDRRLPQTRSKSADLLGAFGAGLLVVAFCGALLVHDPLLFWNDDYELSILPVFADVARSWSEGHLPLLSPYSWVCGNLAGEFQYGTFSLFVNAAVVLIWKFPLLFAQQAAALSITHVFVLAMGGYMLARERRIEPPFALIVGIVAALNGWMICWGATDWFGALGAFAWLPWAWWGMERALNPRRGRWRFVWPVPFIYLLVTGGFPYTVLMLALLMAWLAARTVSSTRKVADVWPLAIAALLGFAISAPAWLALLDYVRGSARETQSAASHLQWRVPFAAWPALILPNWTVNWTDFSTRSMPHPGAELACGLVPPIAIVAALVRHRGEFVRRTRWELALIVIVVIAAMLPTASVFRWSFRWLPMLHLVLALCAAEALQLEAQRRVFTSAFALAVVAFTAAAMSLLHVGGPFASPLTLIMIVIAAGWLALERLLKSRSIPAAITIAALLATYLCIPPNCGVPKYNLAQQLKDPAPLDPERLYLSVYPWPEFAYRRENHPQPVGQVVRPGSTSMWAGLRFITGYSPIRPAGLAREFDVGIHGEVDYVVAERALRGEAGYNGELARLGVDGVIVAREFWLRPQPESEWQIVHDSPESTVYHRRGDPLPVLREYEDNRLTIPVETETLTIVDDSRNRIVADVEQWPNDRFIAVSRPYFAGYVATLNGEALDVTAYRGWNPVIEIPADSHGRLVFAYRPRWLVFGGTVAIAAAAIWVGSVLCAWMTRRNLSADETRQS